jgi:tetratricopeptide (TPR) repeat protein
VIKLCKQQIAEESRYANSCQKILGQVYLKTQRVDEAETLYRNVLDNRELEWAQLGMARTKILQGDWLSAQQWLDGVLQNNPLCMKAYDMQAEIHQSQGAFAALQETLQKATELSPLSILRQQALGEVAQQNNDLVISINALRRAVKLGENSSFDKPSVHNQLAKTAVDLYSTDKELAKPILREALKCMAEMEGRFGKSPLLKTNAQFLESQLLLCSGDANRAREVFEEAKNTLEGVRSDETIEAEIEMIRALRTLGREDEAQVQLEVLSRKYAGKQGALEKLDVLQDEPQSEKNKQLVAEINKKGIAAYNAKNYTAAAEAFSTALQNLPNHMGLRLNYVQALLDDLKQSFNRQVNEKAAQTLTKTGVIISQKHPQYRRYKQLQDTYNNLIKERGNNSEDRS